MQTRRALISNREKIFLDESVEFEYGILERKYKYVVTVIVLDVLQSFEFAAQIARCDEQT